MEPHVAVFQRRHQAGIGDIADQHRVLHVLLGVIAGADFFKLAVMAAEPDLIFVRHFLIAENQHDMLVPGVLHRFRRRRVQRLRQVDADNFRPKCVG